MRFCQPDLEPDKALKEPCYSYQATPSLAAYLIERCLLSPTLADVLVNTKPSSADCVSKDISSEFQSKVPRPFLIQLGLPKFLVVGGFVLLGRGRQPESAIFGLNN